MYIHTYIPYHTIPLHCIALHYITLQYIHTDRHTHTDTYIHKYIHTQIHTYTDTYADTYTDTCMHACIHHTYIHTIPYHTIPDRHTYIHMHIYIHTYCEFNLKSWETLSTLPQALPVLSLTHVSAPSHRCWWRCVAVSSDGGEWNACDHMTTGPFTLV